MDLKYQFESIEIECCRFIKTVHNTRERCIVCMVDEDFDKEVWTRYELRCGHQMHTRCFRKWCEQKQKINCPYCGDIEDIAKNHYCSACNVFGHSNQNGGCSETKKLMKEYYRDMC